MAANQNLTHVMSALGKLTAIKPIRNLLMKLVHAAVKGPTELERSKGYAIIWGEAKNKSGQVVTQRLKTLEGYGFTVESSLAAVRAVLETKIASGALTPSQAFGSDFVLRVRGTNFID